MHRLFLTVHIQGTIAAETYAAIGIDGGLADLTLHGHDTQSEYVGVARHVALKVPLSRAASTQDDHEPEVGAVYVAVTIQVSTKGARATASHDCRTLRGNHSGKQREYYNHSRRQKCNKL